jgi:hypothetical protein
VRLNWVYEGIYISSIPSPLARRTGRSGRIPHESADLAHRRRWRNAYTSLFPHRIPSSKAVRGVKAALLLAGWEHAGLTGADSVRQLFGCLRSVATGTDFRVMTMLFVVFLAAVVAVLFWIVVVAILRHHVVDAMFIATWALLPLALLLWHNVEEIRADWSRSRAADRYTETPVETLVLVFEIGVAAFACWLLVLAILQLELVLAVMAILLLWLMMTLVVARVKTIRADRDGGGSRRQS